ncbi:TPA: hypothetical protein ACXIGC_000169 [Stenotrophomonas maltophilia]
MHYVSQYNYFRSLDRLARSRDDAPDLNEAIAGLSRFSLRDILNNQEIVNMFQQRSTLEMLKRWADSGVKIDGDAIREHLQARERYFVPQYVLKVSTPRYHASQDCGFLKSAFENIETPAEITQQGPERVREFQVFCDLEWPKYKDGPIDRFWAHVGSRFRISSDPKQVSYESGESPEAIHNQSEADIEARIQETADRVRDHAKSCRLGGYLHAPPKTLYSLSKNPDLEPGRKEAFRELLKLKKAIKMLVFNLHRIELEMPEGLLSDELLEALGFLPCKACCSAR